MLTNMLAMTTKEQDHWDPHLQGNPPGKHRHHPQIRNIQTGNHDASGLDGQITPDHPQSTTEYAQHLRKQLQDANDEARWQNVRRASTTREHKNNLGGLCWVANKNRKKGVSPRLMAK